MSDFTVIFRDEDGTEIAPPFVRAGRAIVHSEYRHDERTLVCALSNEGLFAAFEAGFAARAEGYNGEFAGDVDVRDDFDEWRARSRGRSVDVGGEEQG